MKATGIVRRIDDLGRVVIPKEIRRTMRIREGDPLEIFTDKDGEVIFKKYSPLGELSSYAQMFAETVNKTSTLGVAISDRDSIIAVSGIPKKDIAEKKVSEGLERIMESRSQYIYKMGDNKKINIATGVDKYFASVVFPVITEGDVTGTISLVLPDTGAVPSDAEIRICQTTASLLGKQLEI